MRERRTALDEWIRETQVKRETSVFPKLVWWETSQGVEVVRRSRLTRSVFCGPSLNLGQFGVKRVTIEVTYSSQKDRRFLTPNIRGENLVLITV